MRMYGLSRIDIVIMPTVRIICSETMIVPGTAPHCNGCQVFVERNEETEKRQQHLWRKSMESNDGFRFLHCVFDVTRQAIPFLRFEQEQ